MKIPWTKAEITFVIKQYAKGFTRKEIAKLFREKYQKDRTQDSIKHCIDVHGVEVEKDLPRVLVFDIETRSITAKTFGLFDQNIGLNQVIDDGGILCFAAKFLGEKEIFYFDVKGNKKKEKQILKKIWKLLDDCDMALGQNSNRFDLKVLGALFVVYELGLPSSFKKLDTLVMSKRIGKFMSHKLEYMSKKLCKVRKSIHNKYPGFTLWDECEKGNATAWKAMKSYNITDILATEELFLRLAPYDRSENVASAMRAYNAAKKNKKK